jgi:murein DD-endopeptidase MepM/ murein hydrolase activator NlpD
VVLVVFAVMMKAFGDEGDSNAPGVIVATVSPELRASPAPAGPTPTALPSSLPNGTAVLSGFIYPVAGGCLPKGDQLMPNAPRVYRNGIHEGVDFYGVDNCTSVTRGTPVLAAKAGKVIRADLDYVDITAAEVEKYSANPNTEEALDEYRGRQVWVDHGNGIVTRYCHLSAVAPGIVMGVSVTQGQVIASVGESGTPESVRAPGSEYHLHFELRTGDTYLGKGQTPGVVRSAYLTLFAP